MGSLHTHASATCGLSGAGLALSFYQLVKVSGSMSLRGKQDIPIHQIANEAALALALALEGIAGVNCGAGFFP